MKIRREPASAKRDAGRAARDNAFGQAALGGPTTKARNTTFLNKEDKIKHGGYDRCEHHAEYFRNK